MDPIVLFVFVILLAVAFDFVNGWTDAPNAIATVVSTRVLSPLQAVVLAAILNLVGALSGTAVAKTIGSDIISVQFITLPTVAAALIAVIMWSLLATRYGLPTSESHGLVAGLIGAGLAVAGPNVLVWNGINKVLFALVSAPIAGIAVGFVAMAILMWVVRRASPTTVRHLFGRLQILSAAFMAFSHGSNDAQKTMGVITLAVVLQFQLKEFTVPLWVILLSGTTMGISTLFGGWRIIKTLGVRITKLEPIHGFAAETSAAMIIESASRFGFPLSTTHVIGSAIMGVGATRRLSAVRWGIAGEVVAAWVLTWPACIAIGWVLSLVLNAVF